MSVQATRWAIGQKVGSPTAKVILLVLADAADESGYTFVGHTTIAERAEVTTRAVITNMARLEELGFVQRSRRTDQAGHRTSNGVQLRLDQPALSERGAPRAGVNDVHLGAGLSEPDARLSEADARLGERGSPYPSVEPPEEPSLAPPAGKAVSSEAVSVLRDVMWSMTPSTSRARSSKADLARAIDAALKRGGEADAIRAGLAAYFASHDATRDGGQFVKGVHRMVENDRWASFTPAVSGPPAEITPAQIWRPRVRAYTANQYWDTTAWGAKPGKLGCTAPAAILAEFGFVDGVTPLRAGASA